MIIATIDVPKGCTKIFVDLEDGKLIVSCGSSINDKEFFCKETDHMEEVPGVGDFAILWNVELPKFAVCMNFECMSEGWFVGSDMARYNRAIKFRDYEQYLKIRGIYAEKDEP
jgi:hypothetical protein